MATTETRSASHLLPAAAVALCGAVWGGFWIPMHWFSTQGVGGAWVAFIFNAIAMFSALPWLMRRDAWEGTADQLLNGLLLGTAFSLYTVTSFLPMWSTPSCCSISRRSGVR